MPKSKLAEKQYQATNAHAEATVLRVVVTDYGVEDRDHPRRACVNLADAKDIVTLLRTAGS